ncbi:MAG: hypothetical protein Q7U23_10945 [Methylococcales bacterium]|nr:hypothetical protein [Methylococcales bacterium]
MIDIPPHLLSLYNDSRQLAKYDMQYQHNGVSNLFMFFERLAGKRHFMPTDTQM